MPDFRVRVLLQCATPGVTPDQENALVSMPRRVLYEVPTEVATLVARARSGVVTVNQEGNEEALALVAAREVVSAVAALDVLPAPYLHREVAGSYLQSASGSYTFIVGVRSPDPSVAPAPFTSRQSYIVKPVGAAPDSKATTVPVEFRCHVVVEAL